MLLFPIYAHHQLVPPLRSVDLTRLGTQEAFWKGVLYSSGRKSPLGSMNYLIFIGKEVLEDWLADYELFMLSMQVVNDEGKLHAIPLVL